MPATVKFTAPLSCRKRADSSPPTNDVAEPPTVIVRLPSPSDCAGFASPARKTIAFDDVDVSTRRMNTLSRRFVGVNEWVDPVTTAVPAASSSSVIAVTDVGVTAVMWSQSSQVIEATRDARPSGLVIFAPYRCRPLIASLKADSGRYGSTEAICSA